ncbi:hypothetical protein SAMN04487996_114194 [Dyadobacter soli]|uniref:Uncharacterized protein n=1 Tax=Dyadobacter soli TaxID=659014 RepID=A0A1G7QYX2_9BACT|nr:hypothetical protein [Dyadobacter soli]SDG03697.1 hypothetical protein SAMN04487996_114194 [Dyadobacter soli]
MKFTQYFLFTRERPDRQEIKLEWIEHVFNFPEKEEIQSDGRIRRWAKIAENQKYLRIVLLEDGVTVHNAFFDRSFKPGN